MFTKLKKQKLLNSKRNIEKISQRLLRSVKKIYCNFEDILVNLKLKI